MAVCEMRKVYIVGDKGLRDPLIKRLGELELFQPKEMESNLISSIFKQERVKTDEVEEDLSRLSQAIEYLEQFERSASGLGFFPSKAIIKQEQFLNWIKNFDWEDVCSRCSELRQRTDTLKEERGNLLELCELLHPWRDLSIPLKKLEGTRSVAYVLGMISSQRKNSLQKRVARMEGAHLHILQEGKRRTYFLLIYLRELEKNVESISGEMQIEKVQFRELKGIPGEELRKIRRKISWIDDQLDKIRKELRELGKKKIKLMALYDHLCTHLQEKKVSAHASVSSYTFALEGWIKVEDLQRLRKGLRDYPLIDVIVRQPSKKEEREVPVALSNRKVFKPFELVTDLYGIPRYFEIDPTSFIAPFFALFLGICLTDGGYGITLAILAYLIPRRVQVGESGEKLFSILFFSGLATIAIGVITGGIFGLQFSQLSSFSAPLGKLVLFNPLKQPMVFLVLCLALGVVHLLVGIGLALWEDLKKGDIISAVLDHLSWIVLILGVIILGLSKLGTLNSSLATPGLVMFLSGAVVLFLFAGRKSKSLFVRLGKGAYELYGMISLFGDILSYSRLLALGLATSVIATVVNTIANMASGIPFIGPVFMIIILIIGHLGNIVINCLSGFIHTARLQFVEFLGKFYQGGGKSFTPFKREGRYTMIR